MFTPKVGPCTPRGGTAIVISCDGINQLELEAERAHPDRLRAEAESTIAKLQSDTNACVERTKREADARIERVEDRGK